MIKLLNLFYVLHSFIDFNFLSFSFGRTMECTSLLLVDTAAVLKRIMLIDMLGWTNLLIIIMFSYLKSHHQVLVNSFTWNVLHVLAGFQPWTHDSFYFTCLRFYRGAKCLSYKLGKHLFSIFHGEIMSLAFYHVFQFYSSRTHAGSGVGYDKTFLCRFSQIFFFLRPLVLVLENLLYQSHQHRYWSRCGIDLKAR